MNLFTSVLVLGLCFTLSLWTVSGSEETGLDRSLILDAINEAKRLVDDTYLYSRRISLERVRRDDFIKPSDVLRLIKQPKRNARQAVRAADYLEQTMRIIAEKAHHAHKRSVNATGLLSSEDISVIQSLTGCEAQTRPPSCRTTPDLNTYRTITNVCNNLDKPLLGASNTPFGRWLPPVYEDGVNQPKGWNEDRTYDGYLLPLVRLVSNRIFAIEQQNVEGDSQYTFLLTFFGQFNDHDVTFTPVSPSIRSFSNGINCDDSCERSEPCFPIQIPPDDPRLPNSPKSCLPVFRSAPVCGSGNGAYIFGGVPQGRLQINTRSSFVDLSTVYGDEEGLARELRNLNNDEGLLRVNDKYLDNGRELFPFVKVASNMCATRNRIENTTGLQEVPCFNAGDDRVVENIGITTLHAIYFREHNRIARALRSLNPQWSGEQIYQEARKILGAFQQIIVYRDYLPIIVGTDAVKNKLSTYTGYDSSIDPSVATVFSTAANRFAHATLQPVFYRVDENLRDDPRYPPVSLHTALFAPWRILYEGGIDPVLRGLLSHPAKLNTRTDGVLVNEVKEKLYAFTSKISQDLGALNLQRGRDHGLPSYNAWRRFCGLSAPADVNELAKVLDNQELAQKLIDLYGSTENIDPWAAGITEPFVAGGRVGPLFSCIISTQFQKIRLGDRFWWENPGIFTAAQRTALTKVSLARIICDNTGITKVPTNPFRYDSTLKNFVDCKTIPGVDLKAWKSTSN